MNNDQFTFIMGMLFLIMSKLEDGVTKVIFWFAGMGFIILPLVYKLWN